MSELSDLVELLGTETALRLIELYGGTRVSVPKTIPLDHALRAEFDEAQLRALVQYFGGSTLTVPLARGWRAALYDERKMTRREIARRIGVVESTVYKILAEYRAGRTAGERGRSISGHSARAVAGQMVFPFD